MNNQIYRVHGTPSIIHRSERKLIWLSLPTLQPIHKYYTRSNNFEVMSSGSVMVMNGGNISFLTVELPPLMLSEFRRQFFDWQPIGGFCLSLMLILYDRHSITFYDRGPVLKKNWVIEVTQEIKEIKHSSEQKVLGMTVKQKLNTIFIWKLGDISIKPFQEVEISAPVVKWQFHEKEMLMILTETDLQVYSPHADDYYNMTFYAQIQGLPIDFCFLDRPKTSDHSGRMSVTSVGILSKNGLLRIYELYDIDKRVKNSNVKLIKCLNLDPKLTKILCGLQVRNELIFAFESQTKKPLSYVLNEKFEVKKETKFLSELPSKDIQYHKQIICTTEKGNQNGFMHTLWRMVSMESQFQEINRVSSEIGGVMGKHSYYCFNSDNVVVHQLEGVKNVMIKVDSVGSKTLKTLMFLEELNDGEVAFFISGIRFYKLDRKELSFKAAGFVVKNERFKLKSVCVETHSLVFSFGDENVLIEYQIDEEKEKISCNNVRTTSKAIISLRNGRWAQKMNDKILVGQEDNVLATFDLKKFFKTLTQDDLLFEYELAWTTHDGIIMLVKNYIFIFQLTESFEGYSLGPLKKMHSYLHHRFNPDVQDLEVLDPREYVFREGKRVVKLGSSLGNVASQDPYSLPDTVLNRQLSVRKKYPPHHPKYLNFLLEMGHFPQISKIMKELYEWLNKKEELSQLFSRVSLKFSEANEEKSQEDEERVISIMEVEGEEAARIKLMCERILEEPHLLCLEENGSLILESQLEAVLFKNQNSRSLDYYSAIVLTLFQTFQNKGKRFNMMHVAYMIHSINKEEAVSILKQGYEETSWSWIQRYSIIMWYDGKEQIKKWVEEIGTNEFKKNKEPMECMLWYILVGKKNVLTTLFKKYQFNSKEHEAVYKFLQRDFSDKKNRNAAGNNGFKLLDSKRYELSLAFFILAQNYKDAISICLSRLRDINLALLILKLTINDPRQIIDYLTAEGDVWAKHIAYFYQGEHILSFNCLFDADQPLKISDWKKEPELVGFHPCLKQFAQVIERSIPVRREIEEQNTRSQQSQNSIFQSFYEESKTESFEEHSQMKSLKPNYENVHSLSIKFFLRNNCPLLALMLDKSNKKAERAYNLCEYMLTRKITPNTLEIAEEVQDHLGIIKSQLESGNTVDERIEQFKRDFIKALQEVRISVLINRDRASIGNLMHYCYLAEEILKNVGHEFMINEKLRKNRDQIIVIQNFGIAILSLELQTFELVQNITRRLTNTLKPESQSSSLPYSGDEDIEQVWQKLKENYGRLEETKKNKNHQIMDDFEQCLYKYTFKKNESPHQNFNLKIQIHKVISPVIKREIIKLLLTILHQKKCSNIQKQLLEYLKRIEKSFQEIFSSWIDKDVRDEVQKEIKIMHDEGVVSKLKITFLNDFLGEKFEGICRSFLFLKKITKKQNNEGKKLKDIIENHRINKANEKCIQRDAIQIFRNRNQAPRGFALNKNEGKGLDLVLLQKRNMKKVDVCESLIYRNRNNDGFSLIQDDTSHMMEPNIDYEKMLESTYPPLLGDYLSRIIENRNEYDGKGIIRGSAKRGNEDYFKSLDSLAVLETSEMHSICGHHFLPVYLVGGRGSIEICRFENLMNYNRIKCEGMGEITKIASFEERVTGLDHWGNLNCYAFDSKITGNQVFSLKKAGVVDFCMMKPTILGLCSSNSIQVIDTLLHPKRQCVFKYSMIQSPLGIEYYGENKLAVCRKNDVVSFDVRMNMQEDSRELGGKFKCLNTDHSGRIFVGKADNRIKVIDMNNKDNDYEVRVNKTWAGKSSQNTENDKASIEGIQTLGTSLVCLNSEGSIYLMNLS